MNIQSCSEEHYTFLEWRKRDRMIMMIIFYHYMHEEGFGKHCNVTVKICSCCSLNIPLLLCVADTMCITYLCLANIIMLFYIIYIMCVWEFFKIKYGHMQPFSMMIMVGRSCTFVHWQLVYECRISSQLWVTARITNRMHERQTEKY